MSRLFRRFFILLALGAGILAAAPIELGIDVLASRGFDLLREQRVGLLTHPAGVDRTGRSTIEVLRAAPEVNLVALFGPEHGIYGDEKANVPVENRIDPQTGLPVFSLYGRYRHPTPAMLDLIDVLVIDLQDIGTRSYTYVSCMRYALESCFEAGKAVVVLDRPNPLGGLKVDGPPLDAAWGSYVGAFPVPYVHGLTIGELATLAKREPGVLKVDDAVRQAGQLTVVPMRGWKRSMQWPATGLPWIPTSPAIPDLSAVMGYPMTGLGTQLGGFSHGYGSIFPFRLLQYPGVTPERLARLLNERRIPGLHFRVLEFTERGKPRRGVYVMVTRWEQLRPTELSFHMMQLACALSGENPFSAAPQSQQGLFNKHVGSTAWWDALSSRGAAVPVDDFVGKWSRDAAVWQQKHRQYWLYPAP